jgi:type IV pilus assembly protein PilK
MQMAVQYPYIADEELSRWEGWIESTTGIVLRGRKRVLEQGIYPRLLACGLDCLEDYQQLVGSGQQGGAEKAALIDQLTVKDSNFFRDGRAMTAVGDYLLRRSREVDCDSHDFKIWSVGCARGQETWSLAMTAAAQFAFTDFSWSVLGTDISPSAVMYANRGAYSKEQVRNVSAHHLTRFFTRQDQDWQVQQQLRDHVRFGASNLKDIETCPYRDQDVIFCQNVLIYFRDEKVHQILDQLIQRLRPGGLLVLGAGEAADWRPTAGSRWRPDTINAYRVS